VTTVDKSWWRGMRAPRTAEDTSQGAHVTRSLRAAAGLRAENALFIGLFALYAGVGMWLVLAQHSVMDDALSRVANASYVLYSREPKLANIGFVWTPLPSLLILPLLPLKFAWPALVGQGLLANLLSAVAMAVSARVLYGLLGDLGVRRHVRIAIAIAFGLQPMIIWFGANGMTEALLIVFVLLASRRLVQWLDNSRPRHLMAAGWFLAIGYLARYEVLAAGCAALALVVVVSWRRSPLAGSERRHLVVADALLLGLPLAASFTLWALASWVIVGQPFEQFSSVYGNSALVEHGGQERPDLSLLAVQWLVLAPALPVALVAAAITAGRRDAAPLAPVGLLSAVLAFEVAVYLSGSLFGFLRYQIAAIPLLAVLVGYLIGRWEPMPRRQESVHRWRVVGAVACLVPGVLTSSYAFMNRPDLANQEWGHIRPAVLSLLGDTGPVFGSNNGALEIDREVAAYLDARRLEPGSVVIDSGPGFAVLVASANARQFVITSDRDFNGAVTDPVGHKVRYILVSRNHAQHDEVGARWPDLAVGEAGPFWATLEVAFPSRNNPKAHDWMLWRVRTR
jgi:Dolichyl-phosphate-mannose-protein mannosyltransferase